MSQAQPPEQSAPAGSNIRYVEVAPSTGWPTMAKAVREDDEDKIRDCKEDIDTLLVFAGLYSAVLSAFNIESYTALQPDPSDQMIHLLERIAAQTQSYTMASGTLNSTLPSPPPLPTFTAPLWAYRVNGLWFASLIVSLATASLSMLVKQWLREYLAFDYPAPRERVRALQYRRPGLKDWKVFEIAAILPLLLQISLGLFFIGLCFFTASIDERMGLTSVPLVSGWAFFLACTALAPLFSPRCPYKMPLFKSLLRIFRVKATMQIRYKLLSALDQTIKLLWHRGISPIVLQVDEEDKVVTSDADDRDILLSMDIIMANDNFLPMMWDMLKTRSTPEQLLAFITEIIISRIGTEGKYLRPARLRTVPDLTMLSQKAWNTVMEILADLVQTHHSGEPLLVSSPEWLHKATLLLFSSSLYILPPAATRCLRALVATPYDKDISAAHSLASWIAPRASEEPFTAAPLFHRLHSVFTSAPGIFCFDTIAFLYAQLLRVGSPHLNSLPPGSLMELLIQESEIFTERSNKPILEDLWKLLYALYNEVPHCMSSYEALCILVTYSDSMGGGNAAATSALATSWSLHMCTYTALFTLTQLHQSRSETRMARTSILEFGVNAFLQTSDKQKVTLYHSTNIAKGYADGIFAGFLPLDMVRYCLLHIEIYYRNMTMGSTVTREEWDALWSASSGALRYYWTTESWKSVLVPYWLRALPRLTSDELLAEDRHLSAKCLNLIESHELPPCSQGSPGTTLTSRCPDELVAALGLFIMPDDVKAYPRLVQLQQQAQLATAATVPSPQSPKPDGQRPSNESHPSSNAAGIISPSLIPREGGILHTPDKATAKDGSSDNDVSTGPTAAAATPARPLGSAGSEAVTAESGSHLAAHPTRTEAANTAVNILKGTTETRDSADIDELRKADAEGHTSSGV